MLCFVNNINFTTVHLVNAPNKYEGRVEINYGGTWGTVCDEGWDLNEAQVVCRQLGYGPAIAAIHGQSYGKANSRTITWLDDVNCVGTESKIEECSHNGWGNEDCGYYEEAGVQCSASDGNF